MAVDERPVSRRALRRGASLASALHASLAAVSVETPDLARLPFDRQRDLRENLEFASDLGAELVRYEAPDLATGLEHVARARRVTHLVLGHRPQAGLSRLRTPSDVDRLVERLPSLEIHVVGPGADEPPQATGRGIGD